MHIIREQRLKVLIRAKMRAGGPPTDVCIRDISSKGLMLQADAPPPRGTYIEIVGAEQTIVGRVVWAKDRRFGMHTCDPIDVSAAIRGIPARPSHLRPPSRPVTLRPALARTNPESNRALAKVMEFVVIGGFAAALVVVMGSAAYEILSRPLENVSIQLRGGS
jgi:hypothetical protein